MPAFAEEMSEDEVFALLLSLVLALLGGALWYVRGLRITRLGASRGALAMLLLAPPAALAFLWIVLATAAAVEVRTDVRYQFLFVAMGASWAFLLPRLLAFVGISYRDDALDRRNVPAAVALVGTVAGLAVLFAGSNMGEGPSIWNTVATALAATAGLFGVVLGLALCTSFGESIAVERDLATGVRFAGLTTASGVVLGRASAGNWVSVDAMVGDLVALGWPVAVLMLAAIALERVFRPRESNPRPSPIVAGVVPAAAFLTLSLAYVAYLPDWRG